jgi:hypothetical protein
VGRREIYIEFWWGRQKERDLEVGGKIILK